MCVCVLRRTAAAPGEGLGDMKPHMSRLEKEQATWQRHVGSCTLARTLCHT